MDTSFSETHKLDEIFKSVFGVSFKPFYDGLMSVVSKHLCIDVLKFDDWLHEKYGNYEDNEQSMIDVIRKHYGEKGVSLIEDLMM